MKFRGTIAVAALAIGAMTVGTTVSHANPDPAAPVNADEGINYSIKLVDKTVVASLKNGTFELTEQEGATPEEPKQTLVNVKDISGGTLYTFPLEYTVTDVDVPVKPVVKEDGKVLEITPEKPEGFQPTNAELAVKPIASPQENQRAMSDFSTQFGLAVGIGTFVGTAIGAIVGCGLGLLAVLAGCIVGLPTGAAIGGILGTIAFGSPVLLAAGIDLVNTLQAAPGTTKWTDEAIKAQQQQGN
ncbi:hypothetical protein [Nocardia sp. NPDC050406]|uniref:hypothetical protein n=1 Tax=Nocardia sp. NPDC050406 TaxID=3364318 RepID=UPI0037899E47